MTQTTSAPAAKDLPLGQEGRSPAGRMFWRLLLVVGSLCFFSIIIYSIAGLLAGVGLF